MSRYIDTDDIKMAMRLYGFSSPDQTITEFVEDTLPTADVKPVVRGEWIDIWEDNSYNKFCKCSVCDRWSIKQYASDMNYCPNCGAEMRGEANERK